MNRSQSAASFAQHQTETDPRFLHALESLPRYVTSLSPWQATLRMVVTGTFCALSFHALTMCPPWALPICWFFAGMSLTFLFEIGHDCSTGNFYPSQRLNTFLGALHLLPLLQHVHQWKSASKEKDSVSWWRSVMTGAISSNVASFLVVLLAACWFFPYMIYTVGVWGLVKYWLVPFVLFHVGMACFVSAGHKQNLDGAATGWLDYRLRSYLRFNLNVPSYKLGEAVDVVKRAWNRLSLDSSDGPSPRTRSSSLGKQYPDFVEQPAYGSLKLGYWNAETFGFTLSVLAKPLAVVWLVCLYNTGLWRPVEQMIYNLAVGQLGQVSADATITTFFQLTASLESAASLTNLAVVTGVAGVLVLIERWNRQRPVYLVNFVTFSPPDSCIVSSERFKAIQRQFPFEPSSLEFMDKLVDRTGLGEQTYFPPGTLASPPELTLPRAREEACMVMFDCLDQLFATTGTHPRSIDILVVNCSLFCPTPSLTSMIVNRYKMRENIQSYNLGGMGCSAGVIAIHLAKDLLQVHRNCRAVVFSTENITQNWYKGNERGMLISNTLFRVGGAAILLSNRSSDRRHSKYKLMCSIRTHIGADDAAYRAVFQDMDKEGRIGVRLDKDLMKIAGDALKRNITTLGPQILPLSEQMRYLWNVYLRKVWKKKVPSFTPNFTKGIDHFCIHAGGRAVIEAIEKALSLSPKHVAASRAVLHRFGNTSSSSIWYELGYLEKTGEVRRGHKIWQIAFGSGFKCNSAVWTAL